MRALRMACLLTVMALFAPQARAQGQGVIDGRLINGTDPKLVPAGAQLDVIQLGGGMSVLKSGVTDAAGKFRFDGLPANGPMLIRAGYKDVDYYRPVSLDPSGAAHMEIEVYEPTTSAQGIRLGSVQIAFKLSGNSLLSRESYTFLNETRPPRSFLRKDGTFKFSKAPGITEIPNMDVLGPGAVMPVNQPPLESADGRSYYSLYPLRPGSTTFELGESLPYQGNTYTYRKKFYESVDSLNIGVMPQDMTVTGEGVTKIQSDAERNVAVYSTGPIKAGTEVTWTFSGGTPIVETAAPPPAEEPKVKPMPTVVGENAIIIGPLLLLGLVIVLWYANSRVLAGTEMGQDMRIRELRERREQLLNYAAALDARHESHTIDRREYLRLRDQCKRNLRRIATLLAKK